MVSDDGVTIALTNTTADGNIAGIAATTIQTADSAVADIHQDAGHRNWGWYVVHGPMTVRVRAGGTNVHTSGDGFITSRDGGRVAALETLALSYDGVAAGTIATYRTYATTVVKAASNTGGFFMDNAVGADTEADVFVMLE